jgi:hypothetical protein
MKASKAHLIGYGTKTLDLSSGQKKIKEYSGLQEDLELESLS